MTKLFGHIDVVIKLFTDFLRQSLQTLQAPIFQYGYCQVLPPAGVVLQTMFRIECVNMIPRGSNAVYRIFLRQSVDVSHSSVVSVETLESFSGVIYESNQYFPIEPIIFEGNEAAVVSAFIIMLYRDEMTNVFCYFCIEQVNLLVHRQSMMLLPKVCSSCFFNGLLTSKVLAHD